MIVVFLYIPFIRFTALEQICTYLLDYTTVWISISTKPCMFFLLINVLVILNVPSVFIYS